jgi:hypothetical protein
MKDTSDHDGKSKTASAFDQDHDPEQQEVENPKLEPELPSFHHYVARRAYDLWNERGRPEGSAEQDWLQAELELRASGINYS